MNGTSGKHKAILISGYSSQDHTRQLSKELGWPIAEVKRRQFPDGEIKVELNKDNVRGQEVVVVASAAGYPTKQLFETELLLGAAQDAGAEKVTAFISYQFFGRADSKLGERHKPALYVAIEGLSANSNNVVVADPHNPEITYSRYKSEGSPVQVCEIIHYAFPYAVQLKSLIDQGVIDKERLTFAHADAGSTKRITSSFRECMYNMLGFTDRDPEKDGWPQGIKDHDKATGKIKLMSFSGDVKGKDVVVFEDMISSGTTVTELADLLKKMGARTVIVCATSNLLTHDPEKKERVTAAIDRINENGLKANNGLDMVITTDTYDHSLISPRKHKAVMGSPIIHTMRTAAFNALVLRAMHTTPEPGIITDENSVSAILKGAHPAQLEFNQKIARAAGIKGRNPLLRRLSTTKAGLGS